MKKSSKTIYILPIILFIYATIVKIKSPASLFFLLWIGLGILLIIYAKMKNNLNAKTRKFILSASLVFMAFFVVMQAQIISKFKTIPDQNLDYIIILGTEIIGDQPSQNLKLRLDQGIEYLNQNPKTKAIVTGGKVSNPDFSEAQVMATYLMQNAIDPGRIITEPNSTRTIENMEFSKILMESDWEQVRGLNVDDSEQDPSYALVTNDFHMKRALVIAENSGLGQAQSISAPSDKILLVNNLTREVFAFVKYWLLD